MARQGNVFAVLDDEGDDEVSMLIESIAAKVEVSSRLSTAEKNGQKYPYSSDSGRADRRRRSGGYSFYSKRYNGNDAEQSGNSRPDDCGPENGRADGYRYRAKGHADGDRYRAKGSANGDRNGAKGPDGDRQDNGPDGDEGWVEVYRHKDGGPDDLQFTSRNRNYRGERTGYYVVPRSRTTGHETKKDADNENPITAGDNTITGSEGNGSVLTTEVYEEENQKRKRKEEEQKRKEEERKREKEEYEGRKRQREQDAKKMTLKQYEEITEKNKQALGVSKSQERKVTLDKDFESMQQVVTKNKEGDIFIKLNSDKDKLRKKDSIVGKDVKTRKTLSIDEFLKQGEVAEAKKNAENEWQKRQMQRGGYGGRDGGSNGELESPPPPPPVEGLHLFPTLRKDRGLG